jgi:hypothetical protein
MEAFTEAVMEAVMEPAPIRENVLQPGLVLSREEGAKARQMIYDARDSGALDTITAFEMSFDVLMRTVPRP